MRFVKWLMLATLALFPIIALWENLSAQNKSAVSKEKEMSAADDVPVVYRGARIHTASGPVIEKGVLIVLKGKILDVGAGSAVKIPAGAQVKDVSGKVIIPGLVDTHSHIALFARLGGSDGNEMTGPVQPGLRALDAINPNDPGIQMALAGGVTTVNIMPGSGNAIGGQTLYVKLRGAVVETMRVLSSFVLGGIKFANGENPKGAYGGKGQAPDTRMKIAALQRDMLVKAQSYKRLWDAYHKDVAAGKNPVQPERDLNLEPLMEVLERKRTVHFHCHRADDIMTAVRLSKEFNFEIVLQHCTEGYRIAEELAREGVWVSLTLVDSPGGKPEVMGLLEENAAILHKAGVKVAINTDDSVTESRFFLRTGAIAVRGGLPEDIALKALTLHGAQMLHLEDRCGSLDKGKDADFVVLSGRPVQRLHSGAGNVHRRRQGLRSQRSSGLDLSGRRLQFEGRRQTAAAPGRADEVLGRRENSAPSGWGPEARRSFQTPCRLCRARAHGRQGHARPMRSSCWKTARSSSSGRARNSSCPPTRLW